MTALVTDTPSSCPRSQPRLPGVGRLPDLGVGSGVLAVPGAAVALGLVLGAVVLVELQRSDQAVVQSLCGLWTADKPTRSGSDRLRAALKVPGSPGSQPRIHSCAPLGSSAELLLLHLPPPPPSSPSSAAPLLHPHTEEENSEENRQHSWELWEDGCGERHDAGCC